VVAFEAQFRWENRFHQQPFLPERDTGRDLTRFRKVDVNVVVDGFEPGMDTQFVSLEGFTPKGRPR
jgi:hypothetical protein